MFQNVRVKQRDGCTVYLQQGRVMCKVEGTAQTVPLFPAVAAARLLMDKGAGGLRVRVVLEKQNQPFLDLQFAREGEREEFALMLKQAKVTVKTEGGAAANSSSAPPAAGSTVPHGSGAGMVVKAEGGGSAAANRTALLTDRLDGLFSGADRRGILSLYTVLDDWVDVASIMANSGAPPQLKPLTDQMIADAFAAVPTLAAAHEILVTHRGLSEEAFWIAVVQKYLCFKATALDGLVGAATGAASTAASPSSVEGADGYMRYINSTSTRPLRAAKGKRGRGPDGGGDGGDSSPPTSCSSAAAAGARTVFTVSLAKCSQPFERPAVLECGAAALSLCPPRGSIVSSHARLEGLAASSTAAMEGALRVHGTAEARALWVKYWHAIDSGDYAAAAALLAEGRVVDTERPHVIQRAEEVLRSFNN